MCIFTIIFLKTVDLACSYDGKYLFTAGGEDCTVNMWNVDIELALLHAYIHNIYTSMFSVSCHRLIFERKFLLIGLGQSIKHFSKFIRKT